VSAADDAAEVLGQVVELGSGNAREAELADAVSRCISNGPRPSYGSAPDPEIAAGLRSLGQQPTPQVQIVLNVDVGDLGVDRTLEILDRLKERFG
jgi:hypothetical protein